MSLRRHSWMVLLGLCAAASCKRSEDQAAKARIFSPEEPLGTSAGGQEKLGRKLGADQIHNPADIRVSITQTRKSSTVSLTQFHRLFHICDGFALTSKF